MTDTLTARDLLNRMLPLLRNKNLTELAELYAEDGVHELPYAPAGTPRRLAGREQIRAYFRDTLAAVPLRFHEFREVAVHETTDPGVLVAEYDALGDVPPSGARFTLRFLWVLGVADGRITFWRDYWNPLEVLGAQGVVPRPVPA